MRPMLAGRLAGWSANNECAACHERPEIRRWRWRLQPLDCRPPPPPPPLQARLARILDAHKSGHLCSLRGSSLLARPAESRSAKLLPRSSSYSFARLQRGGLFYSRALQAQTNGATS